ncbi:MULTISPECIES: hypothetical protein [Rhizobium]|uniref:hypothetical protein n=1 Tax=Rhizobium TaxID=379 RepID=UPI001441A86B|nr:hypothetical protein [Rhizobium leguminosarum]NKL97785.1 hypothetical protein [Rhizobium leguminosarum bv. viciae]UFW77620.1 hypothetical protein RlegSU303_20625 [Rhizobium leguminosarum bv. viciae]
MRMKLAAASLLALGMATSAFAQANPPQAPTNSGANTPSSSEYDSTGNSGTTVPLDPNATNSTTNNGSASSMNKANCPGQPSGESLQTQGGNSGTTTSEACPDK